MASSYYNHDSKQDHCGNLSKICIRCMEKSKGFCITPETLPLVVKYLWADYESDSEYLPSGLCGGCRVALQSQGKISIYA